MTGVPPTQDPEGRSLLPLVMGTTWACSLPAGDFRATPSHMLNFSECYASHVMLGEVMGFLMVGLICLDVFVPSSWNLKHVTTWREDLEMR